MKASPTAEAFHTVTVKKGVGWQRPGKQAPQEGSAGQWSWQICKRAAGDEEELAASQSRWSHLPPSFWTAFQDKCCGFSFSFPIRAWASRKKERSTGSQVVFLSFI